jgi:acetylglutamate synthase
MRIQKFSRPAVILLATVVTIITSMVAANATQTITTPNAAFISYSLAQGANSAVITPATNRSVLVMGCCTSTGDQGVSQVSLLHIPSTGFAWVGLEPNGAATSGSSSMVGTHITFLDSTGHVDIDVASADTILIQNGAAVTETGNVTLVW